MHGGATDWERTDKIAWAGWGAAFTIAVDAVLYPLEVRVDFCSLLRRRARRRPFHG